MTDTTGQIVFASKFKFGSCCMKSKGGEVYCIRTVQTVSEVWWNPTPNAYVIIQTFCDSYCPAWQTPLLWCPPSQSMCKYCLTWIWWQSDLQQLYFVVAVSAIFVDCEAQPDRCSAESGSAWNSYELEFAQRNTVKIPKMTNLQLEKISLCIKSS